jgi:hypothetical protein
MKGPWGKSIESQRRSMVAKCLEKQIEVGREASRTSRLRYER